jgi:hypothetical protein
MKFLTKNQVITQLKTLANDHLQLRGFGYGDRWELETAMTQTDGSDKGLTQPEKQPFMWVTPIIARVSDGSLYYDFEIIVGDLVIKDESNELEVESDTLLICLDVLSKLDDENYDWSLSKQSNLQPFTEKWDGEFTGHIMNVSLEFMFNYDYCQAPFTKVPDADISAFLNITGIEDKTQIFAITYLVTQLKQNGLWNKMHAIYPFVGGTAYRHSINLKDPNQYKITWSTTGVTHNANGITGDGISGYGDTGYIVAPIYKDNFHLSAYVRNDVVAGNKCAIGASELGPVAQILPFFSNNIFQASINQNTASSIANYSSLGFFHANRVAINKVTAFKNNIKMFESGTLSTSTPSVPLAVLSRRNTTNFSYHSNFNIAMANLGESLTENESAVFWTIIQQFQTYLNRQI